MTEGEVSNPRSEPLLPNTTTGKLVGGSIVTAIMTGLGVVGSYVVEISREIQSVVDEAAKFEEILKEDLGDAKAERQDLMMRIRKIELELESRKEIVRWVERQKEIDDRRLREIRDREDGN